MSKYLDLTSRLKNNVTVIPLLAGAFRTVHKGKENRLEEDLKWNLIYQSVSAVKIS